MDNLEQISPGAGLVVYENDYYNGAQVQVMVGDIIIDTAVWISYNLNQQKVPVFGYGSPYWKFVAAGNIFISGSLGINFKESGYLISAIKDYYNRACKGGAVSPSYNQDMPGANEASVTDLMSASKKAEKNRIATRNVEQAMGDMKSGLLTASQVARQINALTDRDFENYAEKFEDAIWYGSERNNAVTRSSLFSRNLSESEYEITEEMSLRHRRLDQYPAIDIWITYGDMGAPNGVNHSIQKLLDVHFVGESKQITVSEDVIIENYDFIARNRS